MERWDDLGGVGLAQGLKVDVLIQQELDPVQQFGRGGLFLEASDIARVLTGEALVLVDA